MGSMARASITIPSRVSECVNNIENVDVLTEPSSYTHLGQVGRLSDPVDATKGDDERPALATGLQDISEDVNPSLWLQDLRQRFLQGLFNRRGYSWRDKGNYNLQCSHLTDGLIPRD